MNSTPDFLTYSPIPPDADVWGLAIVGSGRAVIQPRTPYPPQGHGEGHAFTWQTGRVLGAYQLVYIAEGSGEFESKPTGRVMVNSGSVIMLFPGVWHRYRPDVRTGWTELWVEYVGPTADRLLNGGVFSDQHPIVELRRNEEFRVTLDSIHQRVLQPSPGFDAEAGSIGLQLLARLAEERRGCAAELPLDTAIARAERILVEHLHDPPPMPAVAAELGLAYSYFRREFKQRTGFSPRHYLQRLRLEKARRLMGTTAEPIKSIADRLGFNSPFHLSSAFKKEFDISPQHWRRAMMQRRESRPPFQQETP